MVRQSKRRSNRRNLVMDQSELSANLVPDARVPESAADIAAVQGALYLPDSGRDCSGAQFAYILFRGVDGFPVQLAAPALGYGVVLRHAFAVRANAEVI